MNIKWIGLIALGLAVFGISYQYNKRFLDWLRFQSLGTRDFIVERLNQMFIEVPPQRILAGLFAISIGSGSVVFLIFLPKVAPGLIFGLFTAFVGWKAPKPIVEWMYRRRVKTFVLQMVDALGLMSNGLKSGLSIVQAMGLVTQEMPQPIQQEFGLVLSQNRVGVSLEEAFTNLSKRIQSDDVEMFVTSINILKETGGNLAETFDTIVLTIRERIRVEKKIETMLQQTFLNGMIVLGVPPVLGLYFYTANPESMGLLFSTPAGWAMLVVIILLEAAGFFVIMKIVKINV